MSKEKCTKINKATEQKKEHFLLQKPHLRTFQDEINNLLDKSGKRRLEVCNILFQANLAKLIMLNNQRE